MVAAALVGFTFVGSVPDGGEPAAPQQRSEYVGLDPASLPLVDCNPVCRADEILEDWKAAHPDATIIEAEPRFDAGRLVGYDIVFQE